MATPPPTLVDELKSLRIERTPERAGVPGWFVALLAVAALAVLGFVGWRLVGSRMMAPEVDTGAVTLVSPAQGAQLLVATGYVVPQRKANISPRIGGRVAKILIEDGTVVRKGQLIAVLEDADYRAQLRQAEADVRAAEARERRAEVALNDAQRSYDREQMVQQQGVSTPAALDAVTTRLNDAKAQVASARADT